MMCSAALAGLIFCGAAGTQGNAPGKRGPTSVSALIVATLVIPSRQLGPILTALVGCRMWITNRRCRQTMGLSQALVWTAATAGP